MQFGQERIFTEGDNKIRAIPKVKTAGDHVLMTDGTITEVIVTNMDGDRDAVTRMAAEIRQRYVGADYEKTWNRGLSGSNPEPAVPGSPELADRRDT